MRQNRDILKDFVKEHSSQLNSYPMREGDLERFAQKVENASLRKGRWSFLMRPQFIATAAAVCTVAIVLIAVGLKNSDRANDRSVKQAEEAYLSELQLKAEMIIKANSQNEEVSREDLENAMESLLNDPVPMSEQLSDELSSKEKLQILKAYYNQKMEGLGQFKTLLANAE